MIRRPPRSTHCISSAASDVYKRQVSTQSTWDTTKSLILAQDERQRQAQHMQVEGQHKVAISGGDRRTGEQHVCNLPVSGEQPGEIRTNTAQNCETAWFYNQTFMAYRWACV
eukprot:TRINITY_DN391_c0_g1_i2.p3 TRINITY_DN391_c0_g1~~TRINITY_DN391_c0_g1_i2.p3  ORF type:complete len:112 (+),score=16.90 TRINITY_DN391_c0_g1_i2:83-418(+)